ncbi:MAG: hypothetical protein KC478_06910 [Bacteriovoracaceae bacterium]|nr:hypothetical protein [Bacteriovoracaceae bacterium]
MFKICTLFVLFFAWQSSAVVCSSIDLADFAKNPKKFMDAPLQKYDKNCKPSSFSLFDSKSIQDKSFIIKKDQARAKFCHTNREGAKVCLKDINPGDDVLRGRAPIDSLNMAENLVDPEYLIKNLKQMEEQDLIGGNVAIKPWSDWYWPIAVGQLSFRYNDEYMMRAYSSKAPGEENVWTWVNEWHQKAMPSDINLLSPAEKYDLLMGDTNYTLTKQMLQAGSFYQQSYGKVESWMGLCHGWAPASYMLPRPVKSLNLQTPSGETLQFKPSDLKALGSLLWATGRQQNRFVGGRCNNSNPQKDSVGRVIDQNCFDTNPGSWHTTVVSQIGRKKTPFVMDATFDYEVWNHPVTAYQYSYFNPSRLERARSLEDAKVEISDFPNDRFKDYRGPEATSVVGILMDVEYLVETEPSREDFDIEKNDRYQYVQYAYDLELDAEGNIVGGEWYTNKHPDFLWTPFENSKAHSVVDDYIGVDKLPLNMITHPQLRELAPHASQGGQPIGRVVEAMLEAASK